MLHVFPENGFFKKGPFQATPQYDFSIISEYSFFEGPESGVTLFERGFKFPLAVGRVML
jgi:hypothetical protein